MCLTVLRNTLGTLEVVSFLVFCVLGARKSGICILGPLMPFLVHPCAPCDVISMKMMPPSGRVHPQLYCVKFEVNPINGSRDIDDFVHPL